MKPEAALKQKLRGLDHRVTQIEALRVFLSKNPALASRSYLKQYGKRPGLEFASAVIKPQGKKLVTLRLERYVEDLGDTTPEERTVCNDVSTLSPEELINVFKEVGMDLTKPEGEDEEDDEEEEVEDEE